MDQTRVDIEAPATGAPVAERAEANLAALSARASAIMDAGSLQDLQGHLADLGTGLAALNPSALVPRAGLAGLFDSRSGRLKRFRTAYRANAAGMAATADALSRGAGALAERHEALSALWADLRDAVIAAEASAAATPAALPVRPQDAADGRPEGATAEAAPLDASAEGLTEPVSIQKVALGRLAALRARPNAEHRLPASLLRVRDGVLAWQADWEDALGLTGRKPRHRRPDIVRLTAARSTLLDTLTLAGQALEQAVERGSEIARRLPVRQIGRETPADQRPLRRVEGKDGTASQA